MGRSSIGGKLEVIDGMWTKQSITDVCIGGGLRAEGDCNSSHLFSCDVCYTCRFFNPGNNECFLSRKDVIKIDPKRTPWKGYFVPTYIKKPEWYRCKWWTKRK